MNTQAIYPNIHTPRQLTIPSWGTVKQFYTILFAQSNDQHSLQAVKRITNTRTGTHTHTQTCTHLRIRAIIGWGCPLCPLFFYQVIIKFFDKIIYLVAASPTWGPLYSLYTQYSLYSVCVLFAFNLYPN